MYITKFFIPEYPYTTDKQTTVLLETDVNTVNTIASEVKEAELTTVQYKNEIKVSQCEQRRKRKYQNNRQTVL